MSTLLFALFGLVATVSAQFEGFGLPSSLHNAGGSALGTGQAALGTLQTSNNVLSNTNRFGANSLGTSSMAGEGQGIGVNSLANTNANSQSTGGVVPFGNQFGGLGGGFVGQPVGVVQPGFVGGQQFVGQPAFGGGVPVGVPVGTGVGLGGFPGSFGHVHLPSTSQATGSSLGTGSVQQGTLFTNNNANTQTNRHGATSLANGNMGGQGLGVQISQLANTQTGTQTGAF